MSADVQREDIWLRVSSVAAPSLHLLNKSPTNSMATYRASTSLLSPLAAASKEEPLNAGNIKDKMAKSLARMHSGDAGAEAGEAKGGKAGEEIVFARGQLSD